MMREVFGVESLFAQECGELRRAVHRDDAMRAGFACRADEFVIVGVVGKRKQKVNVLVHVRRAFVYRPTREQDG